MTREWPNIYITLMIENKLMVQLYKYTTRSISDLSKKEKSLTNAYFQFFFRNLINICMDIILT